MYICYIGAQQNNFTLLATFEVIRVYDPDHKDTLYLIIYKST